VQLPIIREKKSINRQFSILEASNTWAKNKIAMKKK